MNQKEEELFQEHSKNNKQPIQHVDETQIELKTAVNLTSYCCFLFIFSIGIIVSAVYFQLKLNTALRQFNDIYSNWSSYTIVDISENLSDSSCQEPLISYEFNGSSDGCFCQDCSAYDSENQDEYDIRGLLEGNYKEIGSSDSSINSRILFSQRRTEEKSYEYYSEYESEDFSTMMDFKVITASCQDIESLNVSSFYQEIQSILPITFNSLVADDNSEMHLCVTRSTKTNFINSYFTSDMKQCQENYKLCKGTDDVNKSYWFCVSVEEKCPIRQIYIIQTSQVETSQLQYEEQIPLTNGYSLLISRTTSGKMPISKFELFEDGGPCVKANQQSAISSNTIILNPLLDGVFSKNCARDIRFDQSNFKNTMKNFYQHFGIINNMRESNYPEFFLPQNKVNLNLFSQPYIYFDISCRSFFDEAISIGSSMNQLKKLSSIILYISILITGMIAIDISYIIYCLRMLHKKKQSYYPWRISQHVFLSVIYSLLKYPFRICISLLDCIVFYKMINARETQQEIINQNCTDNITSKQFSVMRDELSFYAIFFHIIICLCFWTSDLHLINFLRTHCMMNKQKMAPFDEFFALAFIEPLDPQNSLPIKNNNKKDNKQQEGEYLEQDKNNSNLLALQNPEQLNLFQFNKTAPLIKQIPEQILLSNYISDRQQINDPNIQNILCVSILKENQEDEQKKDVQKETIKENSTLTNSSKKKSKTSIFFFQEESENTGIIQDSLTLKIRRNSLQDQQLSNQQQFTPQKDKQQSFDSKNNFKQTNSMDSKTNLQSDQTQTIKNSVGNLNQTENGTSLIQNQNSSRKNIQEEDTSQPENYEYQKITLDHRIRMK